MNCLEDNVIKLIDETGNRYGQLTVLERAGSNAGHEATWLCQCDCGNQSIVPGSNLRTGNTTSCGCRRLIDEVGNRYGRLVVLERVENDKRNKAAWLCQCDCGDTRVVSGINLRCGYTKSCGCLRSGSSHDGGYGSYDDAFTDEFRRLVRERDLYCCQVCGMPQSDRLLSVHHIDYDKTNTRLSNCISLCVSCHMKTNFNRAYWHAHLVNKIMESNPAWRQLELDFG